jgi:hypothetical protein
MLAASRRGSASAIASGDLALDLGLLPATAGLLTAQAVVRAFHAPCLVR